MSWLRRVGGTHGKFRSQRESNPLSTMSPPREGSLWRTSQVTVCLHASQSALQQWQEEPAPGLNIPVLATMKEGLRSLSYVVLAQRVVPLLIYRLAER